MALFDPRDMLRIAVQDEQTGTAFYKSLAAATKRPDVQAECIAISKQEEVHAERFQKMLDGLLPYEPMEEYDGQYEQYLNALIESRAFSTPEQAAARARAAGSDADAIDIALGLERGTLVFLGEIKSLLPPTHVELVQEVIKEEQNHVTELTRLKRTLAPGRH